MSASRFSLFRLAPLTRDPRHKGLVDCLEQERERWFLWVPVCFGTGIAAYFSLPQEPRLTTIVAGLAGAASARYAFRLGTLLPALTGVVLCVLAGLLAGKIRTEVTRAPVLDAPVKARMVAGFIEAMELQNSNRHRITLRVRALQGIERARQPERIRFIWNGKTKLRVGDGISVRVSLRPPPAPVRPGGYDFARRAWFRQIGAVGFAVAEPVISKTLPARPVLLGLRAAIARIRMAIAGQVVRRVPGETGAIVNALIVGQRGRVPEKTLEHLRRSGLSHMLAISGLHMAMIAGALYWLLRGGLAAIPVLALNGAIRKGAAIVALAGGVGYLMISGASVATQRAAIMIGLMLIAILLDRPAISQRNVALAALVILVVAPENLLEIGFQMSFAAVVALIAFYEWWREQEKKRSVVRGGLITNATVLFALRVARSMVAGTLVTTLIAGVAVAPLGAFHFHKVAQFSILANLLAMPVFTLVVMPMALVTFVLLPFGLESAPLSIMSWGVERVTTVAGWVSDQPNAVRTTAAMPQSAFVLMVFGGLWICLWQRRWRYAGVILIAAGLSLTPGTNAPDILIARDGRLVAVRTASGILSGSPGRIGKFELARWLEADGDARSSRTAVRGAGFNCDRNGCTARSKGLTIAMPRTPANLDDDCRVADIVILAFEQVRPCPSARLVVDQKAIDTGGVHEVSVASSGRIQLTTVEGVRGNRPWTRVGQNKGRQIPE